MQDAQPFLCFYVGAARMKVLKFSIEKPQWISSQLTKLS